VSERGEVAVLLPLARKPVTAQERQELLTAAVDAARELVHPLGGRVLGVTKVARAVDPATMATALRVTFMVEAPESAFPHRSSFQVDGIADHNAAAEPDMSPTRGGALPPG
jgi:hypothetical protein